MKRRDLILGAGAMGLAAPTKTKAADKETFKWKMVTTWPPNFPGLGTGAMKMAKSIEKASSGRLKIKVFGGGELVPPFEVFDYVSGGGAEMGHGAAYYWRGKSDASQIFTALPFGLNAMEMNGWFYYGGGLELYRDLYEPFNLRPFPAGNSGCQMGGWFKNEIKSAADLQGLKMRIPGLGGEILRRYYYYPGWHETGPTLECIVNKEAFDSLPPDLQAIVEIAASATNDQMLAEFMARNAFALTEIEQMDDVKILPFPDDVMTALEQASDEIIAEISARDEKFKTIYQSFLDYMNTVSKWTEISEFAMLANRYKKD